MRKAFCVRDKVLVKSSYDGNKGIKGRVGTIVKLDCDYKGNAAVKFHEEIKEGHSCSGIIPERHGYWIPATSRYLEVVRRRGKEVHA